MNDEKMSATKMLEVKRLAGRAETAVRQLARVIAMSDVEAEAFHAKRVKVNEYMGRYFKEGRVARREKMEGEKIADAFDPDGEVTP